MKTIKQVDITPVFVPEYIPETLEPNHIYISQQFKSVIHLCLCGCGEKVSTPICEGMWSLTTDDKGRITLSPSVGNFSLPCRSHYIITKNRANFV